MKAQVFGNRKLVHSASAEMTPAGLSLFVNMRERHIVHHRAGGSGAFSAQFFAQAPEHQAIEFFDGPEDDMYKDAPELHASVVFSAETEEEAEALRGIPFECREKEQLHILLVPHATLGNTTSLVDISPNTD